MSGPKQFAVESRITENKLQCLTASRSHPSKFGNHAQADGLLSTVT